MTARKIDPRNAPREGETSRLGALSVRPVFGFRNGFAVHFDHGSEVRPNKPVQVPAWCRREGGAQMADGGIVEHPTLTGNGVTGDTRGLFRTKTAAARYMVAVSVAGILPKDRPATRDEIRALRDWIEAEADA